MRRIVARASVVAAATTMLLALALGPAQAMGASCTMDGITYEDGVGLVTANGGGWYTSQTCHDGSWQWDWTKQLPLAD